MSEVSASRNALRTLDAVLQESDQPLPAISVSNYDIHGKVLLPGVWIGFGRTELQEGLRPNQEVLYHVEGRPVRAGLTVPLIEDSLSTATFHIPRDESKPSYWQQWYSDRYIIHVVGQPPNETLIGGDADAIGDGLLTTWLKDEAPFNLPTVIFDDPEMILGSTMSLEDLLARRDRKMIAVGRKAVSITLQGLKDDLVPKGRAPILDPLYDMLATIAATLEVEI
ncbi:MAG TPA: hypothetical protein VLF79_02655 [Candidatus Saccharimonadales bacterium]|nr:hypothetical protein [Candidatus Saccharimonadales bacterium]